MIIPERLTPVFDKLKFFDEFGIYLGMNRLYGRAAPGERIYEATGKYSGTRYTVLGAMGLEGICAPLLLRGAVTTDIFVTYMEYHLTPILEPRDILLMDNLAVHKNAYVERLVKARGARLVFLPPYSPDFNPIEPCWSKVKAFLRKVKAGTYDVLVDTLADAFRTVTSDDVIGWLGNCGYI